MDDPVLPMISYSLPEVPHGAHINDRPDDLFWLSAHGGNETTDAPRHGNGITPSYLHSLYKTMGYIHPQATDRNALGIGGLPVGGQFPSPQDLALFMNLAPTVTQVNGGGYDLRNLGIEANLDIHTSTTAQAALDNPYLCWLRDVIAQDDVDIPRSISTSYGGYEYIMPPDGDYGVGDGDYLVWGSSGELFVQFPSRLPGNFVGGTTGHNPEVAASMSGGGFSTYFPRQPYQTNAVSTFLQNFGDKHSGLYKSEGNFDFVSGTSGSAPVRLSLLPLSCLVLQLAANTQTVASTVSLSNDYLISTGSQPFGFLNPWMHGTGLPGLNDITSGPNPGCNTDGFSAVAGWDPVTGLGTLGFAKLEEIIDDRLRNSGTSSTQNQPST
ncbi:hypothetical protein EDB87DRAFT_1685040 [Lactarius vividus]|nr:hypothetical protein EDB87DRAFT_1685040 [Lactarius vividus]